MKSWKISSFSCCQVCCVVSSSSFSRDIVETQLFFSFVKREIYENINLCFLSKKITLSFAFATSCDNFICWLSYFSLYWFSKLVICSDFSFKLVSKNDEFALKSSKIFSCFFLEWENFSQKILTIEEYSSFFNDTLSIWNDFSNFCNVSELLQKIFSLRKEGISLKIGSSNESPLMYFKFTKSIMKITK